jgi:hypothetical protein
MDDQDGGRSLAARPKTELGESWAVPIGHSLALMTTMRLTEAIIWPNPFADIEPDAIGQRYRDAFTLPPKWDSDARLFEWDGDRWEINVIGHALFGSELFLRPRICKKRLLLALAFTTAASAVWEYGFEANGVRPSGVDLWYTPLSGLVLGEARYLAWSAAAELEHPIWRAVLTGLFDPLGELERGVLGVPC